MHVVPINAGHNNGHAYGLTVDVLEIEWSIGIRNVIGLEIANHPTHPTKRIVMELTTKRTRDSRDMALNCYDHLDLHSTQGHVRTRRQLLVPSRERSALLERGFTVQVHLSPQGVPTMTVRPRHGSHDGNLVFQASCNGPLTDWNPAELLYGGLFLYTKDDPEARLVLDNFGHSGCTGSQPPRDTVAPTDAPTTGPPPADEDCPCSTFQVICRIYNGCTLFYPQ